MHGLLRTIINSMQFSMQLFNRKAININNIIWKINHLTGMKPYLANSKLNYIYKYIIDRFEII